ncbi:uncharacterized protein LOC124491582 isoform X1 [Dermatophagoides farinae]|uniref:uncharacterized protein LOC124491582 isoform X1 n=1 Tax=Dermatophagoides farinae TaxID=6954 RepID=UPI003F5F656A
MKSLFILWPFASIITIVQCIPQPQPQPISTIVNTGSSAVARSEDGHGNYAFGYNENHATGGSFRKEKGAPGIQIGSYGLRAADGRMRIVNYVADVNGFRASVETNEPGTTVDSKQMQPAALNIINGHTVVGDGHGTISRHDGTFSYSTSTAHIASALPNVYASPSANYAISTAHPVAPNVYPALPSYGNQQHHHHSSGGGYNSVPMSYSTSTTHVAPAYLPQKDAYSHGLPAYPALLPPPPPPTVPALAPAQPVASVPILAKNDYPTSNYIAETNFQSSGHGPIVEKVIRPVETAISTAPATISAPNGLSIPLSISIHTLGNGLFRKSY